MRNTILSLLFMMCATMSANAQTFLDQLKKSKPGEGKVTVTQSKDIDNLVNGVKGISTTTTTPKTTEDKTVGNKTKVAPKPNHNKDNAAKDKAQALYKEREREHERENTSERKAEGHKTERTTEETGEMSIPTVDMSKKVMRNSHKISGYRVQAFAGGNTRDDKQRAQQIGNAIKMKHPDQPVYVHFYSPRWICRVGNYRTYGEAQKMLHSLRAMGYKGATIVKGTITVQY